MQNMSIVSKSKHVLRLSTHPYVIFFRFELKKYTQYIPELNNSSFDTKIR
jgi:hypothetical protein